MADPLGDSIFEKLKEKADPKVQSARQEEVNRRVHEQYEKTQSRLGELVNSNATRPASISSVTVLNATHTRRGFLERVFKPLLAANNDNLYTLADALKAIGHSAEKLKRFDIFHDPISIYVDRPDATDPSTTPNDLSVFLSVREKPRFKLSSGTWAGSNDGSIYGDIQLRNILGGAESLYGNASYGTRTKSSYSGGFETPIFSNPDLRWQIGGLASATSKAWASHEEMIRGADTKLRWMSPGGHRHELGYSGIWRQITQLAEKASPTIRADAGDSFKSSVTHTWINDRRDHPVLPSRGYLMKSLAELAGIGLLKGDVAFGKVEVETQAAIPVPVPFLGRESGISLTAGLRGGLLCPLTLAGSDTPVHSRINDRFTLGGPTDVRGFRFAGLGPRDGGDSVGGDVYAAGGISLLLPFPRVGKDQPLRLQAFINGGRLLALHGGGEKSMQDVQNSMMDTIRELGDGLPSMAAGIGVVYALDVARFEVNFSLPLVVRKGEDSRKGISLGLGMSFL